MNLDIQKSQINYKRPKDVFSKYPGIHGNLDNMNYAMEQAVNGKKVKGFQFDLPIGITKESIDLSGTARQLLGLKFNKIGNIDLKFTLTVNNDVILRDSFANLFSTANINFQEFFEYLRALSGQDTIDISFEATAAEEVYVNFYYI